MGASAVPRGGVHHVELWTEDLAGTGAALDWLLRELAWGREENDWPTGRIWRHEHGEYVVLEQSPDVTGPHDRLHAGLNHLALTVGSRERLDALRAGCAAHGWTELFAEDYPHAGGPQHTALFVENAEGFEIEVAITGVPSAPVDLHGQIVQPATDEPPPGADPFVVPPVPRPIEIREYDERWPQQAADLTAMLRDALGARAIRVEHVGSTAVPGLAAKPIIDLDLTVADPADEDAWLPSLLATGLVLTVREPWWYEHRVLRTPVPSALATTATAAGERNESPEAMVHVFGPGSPELVRHVVFRDHLRRDATDRELYAATKRAAASASTDAGETMMQYNARKDAVVREIYARAFRSAGFLDREH